MYSLPLISWGGFSGGIIVVFILKLAWKTEIFKLLDLISPGYALALSIGRIGCFMGGCCYGKHTDSSWGVYFTHCMAPASQKLQPLIPIQLISSILLFILTLLLIYIYIKSSSPGNSIITFIIIYSISRFIIEYFRDDSRHYVFSLSDGQIYSILMLIAGIILIFRESIINLIRNKTVNRIK
jgi:phosphatidylglycerol:prolipoprotein diacylglycerol transferase